MADAIRADRGEFLVDPTVGDKRLLTKQPCNSLGRPAVPRVKVSAFSQCASDGAPARGSGLVLDAAQAHWHLDLLGRDERDTNIRAIPHKGMKGSAINGIFGRDLERAQQWQAEGRGLYLQPNPGGTKAHEVSTGIALFFEHDDRSKQDQKDAWIWLGLPQPSFQLDTGGKSIHQYYVLSTPIGVDQWIALMDRLIAHAGSDPNCKGPNRMMRMAGGWYFNSHGKAVAQSQIIHATDHRYDAELFEELLPSLPRRLPCHRPPRNHGSLTKRSLQDITDALSCIPRRESGSNSYGDFRNLLWGLIAACSEAGYSAEWAIELMEDHSPSSQCGWDVRQVAASGGDQITAGTFWWQARQYGWRGGHA
jgi:hypothetical protein